MKIIARTIPRQKSMPSIRLDPLIAMSNLTISYRQPSSACAGCARRIATHANHLLKYFRFSLVPAIESIGKLHLDLYPQKSGHEMARKANGLNKVDLEREARLAWRRTGARTLTKA
ncbi:hypothetical protein [Chelatococcus asaccharovorans]|uniref:hypothetical protein n=1 Tax=Chelatococcus asaccharovorans TaxID=28210 RepID=UPI001475864E|nr:hypothetical protein [Chelatococcus asaccharovorans]MBS7705612.1 hypothetical protein [Chelatococcus asaccharovorans]